MTTKPKPASRKTRTKVARSKGYPIPDCTPFRHAEGKPPSGYAMLFAILHAHPQGMRKADLLTKYRAWCGKPEANCRFDVHVVTTPREDGTCHRSVRTASRIYWVEKKNDFLRLHLVPERK